MQPWIQFAARDAITLRLPRNAFVVEFGSGGSTLFWLGLGARVVSIEHDQDWARAVRDSVLLRFGSQASLDQRVVEPVSLGLGSSALERIASSTDPRFTNMSFLTYVEAASDIEPGSIDLLVVDGRARAATLLRNVNLVGEAGMIVLDNSERPEYQGAIEHLSENGWKWEHFFGPFPYLTHFSRTSIARKA